MNELTAIPAATQAPGHHIPAELLLDYAAGTLAEPWSLVVACHLSLCPHCRADLAGIERLAGAMLDGVSPQSLKSAGFAAIEARLGEQEPPPVRKAASGRRDGGIPAPLRDYLKDGVDRIDWRWSGAGLHSWALPVPKARGGMVSLLKIAPGAAMPLHTHRGEEMTLVLSGGFTDESGAFTRGDVEIADGNTEHRPVAMNDGPCICLAVTDAPLNFRGSFGWVLNQWARLSA